MTVLRRWLRTWGELAGATAGLAAVSMALWALAVTAPVAIRAPGGPPILPVYGPAAPGGPPPLPSRLVHTRVSGISCGQDGPPRLGMSPPHCR